MTFKKTQLTIKKNPQKQHMQATASIDFLEGK